MQYRVFLVGMPNCGKSSLFNLLTGRHVHIGNRAGVTVDAFTAEIKDRSLSAEQSLLVTDLPGIRSLSAPTSADEKVTLAHLTEQLPDQVLCVCNATGWSEQKILLRELFQTVPGGTPVALVLNFCDQLEFFPDGATLSRQCGIPVFPISARTCQGIRELRDWICHLPQNHCLDAPCHKNRSNNPCYKNRSDDHSPKEPAKENCSKDCPKRHLQNRPQKCRAEECRRARPQQRISSPAGIVRRLDCILLPKRKKKGRAATFWDGLLQAPLTGIPLFCLWMFLTLWLVFGCVGEWITAAFRSALLLPLLQAMRHLTRSSPDFLRNLLCNGVSGGIGAVLDFLLRLLLLFLLQSMAEQTGLLARFNRLFDRPMSRFGLRGDAVTPLLLGYGCTVPAILCTRSMKDREAACRCACFLPVITCSARMPLCRVLARMLFGSGEWIACGVIWLCSALLFLLFCALVGRRRKSTPVQCHEDDLPDWLPPSLSESVSVTVDHLLHFLGRAGGVILLSSILIWLLSNISPQFVYIGSSRCEESLLARLGDWLSPLFAPLGFDNWRACAALLSGAFAKEAALSTLGVLLGEDAMGVDIGQALATSGVFSRPAALSFLVFYCFYFPCFATLGTMRAEKCRLRTLLLPVCAAYLLSFLAYRIGLLLF